MKPLGVFLTFVVALTMISTQATAQLQFKLVTSVDEVVFHYADLENFIEAMRAFAGQSDTTAIIQAYYLDRASPGLQEFIRENKVKAEDYLQLMRRNPSHYGSLTGLPERLKSFEEDIREDLSRLQSLIPGLAFLPVYYVVGFYGGLHAEPSLRGLLLAYGNPGESPHSPGNTVVHETVHAQQALTVGLEEYQSIYSNKKTLLSLAIREGTARFLTELSTGQVENQQAYEYFMRHREELMMKFKREMYDSSAGDWMWAKPKNSEQPQQVGYVLGSMIVKAYYDKAIDKSLAISEILSVTDYQAFYELSGFEY